MFDIFINALLCFCSAFGLLLIGGYIFYWINNLKTVDEGMYQFSLWLLKGIKKVGSALFWWVKENTTGEVKPERIINQSLPLTDEDLNALKHRLGKTFLETPVFEAYSQSNDCIFISFTAVGLKEKYQSVETEQLLKLVEHCVKSYYQDTRQQNVFVKVLVAAPTRIQFAIPLSGLGLKYLNSQEQIQASLTDNTAPDEIEPLEEEFHILDDEDKE